MPFPASGNTTGRSSGSKGSSRPSQRVGSGFRPINGWPSISVTIDARVFGVAPAARRVGRNIRNSAPRPTAKSDVDVVGTLGERHRRSAKEPPWCWVSYSSLPPATCALATGHCISRRLRRCAPRCRCCSGLRPKFGKTFSPPLLTLGRCSLRSHPIARACHARRLPQSGNLRAALAK